MSILPRLSLATLALAAALPASATAFIWTDWYAANSAGGFNGRLATGSGEVAVQYQGRYTSAQINHSGTNIWQPTATYTGAEVDVAPHSDLIGITGGSGAITQRLLFSQAVVDPVLAIVSLGRSTLTAYFDFGDLDFDIISSGFGAFGGNASTLVELPGNVLAGTEGNGLIRFHGTFSELSWQVPVAESWAGITVGALGIAAQPVSVAEPGSLLLTALGIAGAARLRRSRHQLA